MWNWLSNWKSYFLLLALGIIGGTIYYANYLARKIEKEERQRVAEWIDAKTTLLLVTDPKAIQLANLISKNNEDMPLIATDEIGRIVDYNNIDSQKMRQDTAYLQKLLVELKAQNPPIDWQISNQPPLNYKVYYGNTALLNEVAYYPMVQMLLVSLFIVMLVALLNTQNKSTQNQVWAGMAKETAHQLGTPISSLQGWVEVLKEQNQIQDIISEIEKDVMRLKLVSDRFGKIGSSPQLEHTEMVALVNEMVAYMKRRAPEKITFDVSCEHPAIYAMASPTLLNWVVENLLKNALDAMEGKGNISVNIRQLEQRVIIDVSDTGKGIASAYLSKVFEPGFTTKKRGWGLGLSLSKRIIVQMHHGQLFVKQSEANKGTTFRLTLQAANVQE